MNIYLFLLYFAILMGCRSQNNPTFLKEKDKVLEMNLLYDTLHPKIIKKTVEIYQIKKYFVDDNGFDFDLSIFLDSIKIKKKLNTNSSRHNFYTVQLPSGLPTGIERNYTILIYDNFSMFVLPVSSIINVITNKDHVEVIGLSEVREFEYVVVYSISKEIGFKKFDSSLTKNSGIFVSYFKDDECIDFFDDRSHYKLLDNGDILFTNSVINKCKQNQNESFKLKIKLSYDLIEKKWKLSDENGNADLIYKSLD